MKAKKREIRTPAAAAAPAVRPAPRLWPWAAGALAAAFVAFQAYAPVLHGPFLFDDDYLPFRVPNFAPDLRTWLAGVRPLLMLTYWVNYRISPQDTFSYHLFNLCFHLGAGLLVFAVLRRLLEAAGVERPRREWLAGFGGGLFLLHPVQTESVAYVASRSENLSVMLFLAAWAAFLYRGRTAVSWGRALAIAALFGGAVATKEHTLVAPAILLLTDYWWNPGFSFEGIRRNWRLYVPLAAGGAAGAVFVRHLLFSAGSAGFAVAGVTWYEYFYTQWRALFVYLRLFALPVGQNIDYAYPLSRTPFEHGAIVGGLLLAALTAAAWVWRRRYPLASFGWFAFLILMAPTSSVVPIKDAVAERRLYLSIIGLLLIALEFLRRVRWDRRALAAALAFVLGVAAVMTNRRNQVWSDRIALWEDTVRKAPRNPRAHFQLAYAYYESGRCGEAVEHYRHVAELQKPAYDLLVDWALAYDCLSQPDRAIEKLRQAAAVERSAHAWSLIGMMHAKRARWSEALEALATAESIDPAFAMTFVYRGGVHLAQNDFAAAAREYRRALALDPSNAPAREALAQAEARLRSAR